MVALAENSVSSLVDFENKEEINDNHHLRKEFSSSNKNEQKGPSQTIEEAIKHIRDTESLSKAGCEVGNIMVGELVRAYHQDDRDEMARIVDITTKWYSENFPGFSDAETRENEDIFKAGFLAETATIITLQEMNFEVLQPTVEDDTKGKIDAWAIDKNGKEIYAIQIKSNNRISDPEIIPVDRKLPDRHIDFDIASNENEKREIFEIGAKMLQYMSENGREIKSEYPNYKLRPLILFVPGGNRNENALYNVRIGTPSTDPENNFNDKLIDAFFKEVWV